MRTLQNLLMLFTISTLLVSCAGIRIKVDSTCSWAELIVISDETLDFLVVDGSPSQVIDELNTIADHNELYKKYCE